MIFRLLKSISLTLLFFVNSMAIAHDYGVYEDHPYEFLIKKTIFQSFEEYSIYNFLEGSSTYPGAIKKSAFRIRNNYDLSNQDGWQATGITRILSLGSLYPWATDIDIYDTRGVRFGLIYGNLATFESAKFDIYSYDEKGNATLVGVALANEDFTHFSITKPGNYLPIGEFVRNTKTDNWTVSISTPEIIDDRIIRIFAGFLIDYQDKFLKNN